MPSTSFIAISPTAAATSLDHGSEGLIDIIDTECNVTKTRLIRPWQRTSAGCLVAKNLQCRPTISVSRQKQMNSAKMRITQGCNAIEPFTGIILIRTLQDAAKNVAVETHQIFPVATGQVGVNETRFNRHGVPSL